MLPVRKFEERLTTSMLLKAHIGSKVPGARDEKMGRYAWPVSNTLRMKCVGRARNYSSTETMARTGRVGEHVVCTRGVICDARQKRRGAQSAAVCYCDCDRLHSAGIRRPLATSTAVRVGLATLYYEGLCVPFKLFPDKSRTRSVDSSPNDGDIAPCNPLQPSSSPTTCSKQRVRHM